MTVRQLRVAFVTILAAVLVASVGALALLPADAATSTALTKKGTGEFSDVEVTVSKSKDLINEVVTVSWKGAKRSEPVGFPQRNFMQLMQCWGDAAAGPDPEQCQFGALELVTNVKPFSALHGRRMSFGPEGLFPADPDQVIKPEWGPPDRVFLPFKSVSGLEVRGESLALARFFDVQGTNEIPIAATRSDGTGTEFFEVQTATEAPGLGCGSPVVDSAGKKTGRACWLVVVPRSTTEVDGSNRIDDPALDERLRRLQTSSLSARNWANRIVFPLDFQAIGGNCPIGVGQVTLLGNETATEAVSRWQTKLCQTTNTVFDFNQVPDTAGRANLTGSKPGMALVGAPLSSDPPTGKPVYAPISVSGLGFAYNVEIRVDESNPEEIRLLGGQRLSDLKLNARLVAKLLTQSYRGGTNNPAAVPTNPVSIEMDPEFRALNPLFDTINQGNPAVKTVITPLNPSDPNSLVWEWIGGDQDAKDFIAGKPDPSGMVINEAWKGVDLVRSDFPKLDQTCAPATVDVGEQCLANSHPYAGDMHEAVRAAVRGDTLARLDWDGLAEPPQYKRSNPLPKGTRALMVVADSGSAARFNLPMVKLRNASGKFVAPTSTTLAAGLAAMTPDSKTGFLIPKPNAKGDDVYPLTTVSYAASIPAALAKDDRAAYAAFIRYAVGDGQKAGDQPGQLPAGYLPLTKAMVDTAKATATAIADYKAPGASPGPTPKASPEPTPKAGTSGSGSGSGGGGTGSSGTGGSGTGGGGTGAGGGSGSSSGGGGTTATTPPDTSTPMPTETAVPQAPVENLPTGTVQQPGVDTVAGTTPLTPVGKAGKVFLWVFLIGALAAIGGRALPLLIASGRLARPKPVARASRPATRPSFQPPSVAPQGVQTTRRSDAGA